MHTYTTNVDQVAANMRATMDTFGFTDRREGRALGELIVDEIIDGIVVRSIDRQCDGDGVPWPKNAPATRDRKYKQYGEALVNKDTGQMLSVKSLRGTTTITQYLITMTYGTGEAGEVPDRLPAVHRINVGGETVKELITDVDKAIYAVEQGRSFYELDDTICGATFAVFTSALGAHLANPGR
jgi:hypothetical protein